MYSFFQVLYPSVFIFFVCITYAYFKEKKNFELLLIAIFFKVFFFFFYFFIIFDGSQVFLDDITYLDQGKKIIDLQIENNNYFIAISNIVGSLENILYPLINSLAILIFEAEYLAPVALNVVFSFLTGLLIFKYLYKGQNKYIIFFLVFLNPTIITWSSFFNLKDTVLLFLTVINFMSFKYYELNFKKFLLIFFSSFILIYFLRSYYCYIILAAIGVIVLKEFSIFKIIFFVLIFFTYLVYAFDVQNNLNYYINTFVQNSSFSFFNFIKFFLTPIPFNTTGSYKFLDFVQIYSYLMMPFFLIGYLIKIFLFLSNKLNKTEIFILICFSLFMILVSSMEIIRGPRHRYHMEAVFIIYQYYGLVYFFRKKIFSAKKNL